MSANGWFGELFGRGARRTGKSPEPSPTKEPGKREREPSSRGAASSSSALSDAQKQEIVARAEVARKTGNADILVHGWQIRAKRRDGAGRNVRSDIEVRDPTGQIKLCSIVRLRRHFGLEEEEEEEPPKRPKTRGGGSRGGGDDGEEDDDDEEEEDEEEEEEGVGVGGRGRGGRGRQGGDGEGSSWVACDACGKWRELPSGSGKLPPMWYCHLHPVAAYASCDVPEALYEDDEMLSWDYGMTDRDVGVDPMGSFEAMEAEALAEAEAEAAAMAAAEAKKGRGGGGRAAAAAGGGGGGGGGKGKAKASGSGGNGGGGGAAANGGFVGSSAETRFLEEIKEELQIREPLTYIAAAHDLLSSPQVVYQAHTRTLTPHPPHTPLPLTPLSHTTSPHPSLSLSLFRSASRPYAPPIRLPSHAVSSML